MVVEGIFPAVVGGVEGANPQNVREEVVRHRYLPRREGLGLCHLETLPKRSVKLGEDEYKEKI